MADQTLAIPGRRGIIFGIIKKTVATLHPRV